MINSMMNDEKLDYPADAPFSIEIMKRSGICFVINFTFPRAL